MPARAEVRDRAGLSERYRTIRALSLDLARPLSPEDQQVQSMPDASPTKWHLAHITWFFETFVLGPFLPGYKPFHPDYGYLFNSYYEAVGPRLARPRRGLLTRPPLADVIRYRRHVDAAMETLLRNGVVPAAAERLELGLNHEQQHQELLLTDVKHLLWCNPLSPAYDEMAAAPATAVPARPAAPRGQRCGFEGGVRAIGHDDPARFAFDNECPRHGVLVRDFRLAVSPVSNRDYAEFVADGGYRTAGHWLSDGWTTVQTEGWDHPIYWEGDGGSGWREFTLGGMRPLDPGAPVSHLSYYEADAYARWAGKRLPTEAEWEVAATSSLEGGANRSVEAEANLLASGRFHPAAADAAAGDRPQQLIGDVWEWTQSPYVAYPGFRPAAGAVGEYNGKFMVNQLVLRGGSCLTPPGHIRTTYRNFFYPHQRWQMTGLRLAEDA